MKIKRLFSLALALVLVLTMVPFTARAATVASGNCGAKVTWTLDDEGTLTISGTGPMEDYGWEHPQPWSSDDIVKVVVNKGVTTIGDFAFAFLSNVTSVTIPNSVTSIGNKAFSSCTGLTSITIPDSVSYIGFEAFFWCNGLTSVTIPKSVTFIDKAAFSYCENLTGLRVDKNNPNYSSDSSGALFDKKKTTLVCVPAGIEGEYAVPASVKTIGESAFYLCSKLTSVTIPEGVTTIGANAFASCFAMTSISIPSTITSLGEGAMAPCTGEFYYNGTEEQWQQIGGYHAAAEQSMHYVPRLAGGNRFETAILVADKMKETLNATKFSAVILANGYNFADALAGSYLSAMKKAPILLTWNGAEKYNYLNDATIKYVKANLKPGGTVYILGGKSAVPASIDAALKDFNIKRMDGANRFETNLMILDEAGVKDGSEILVCTSTNFADSLSASAVGKPILLVFNESGKLYGDQPQFLDQLKAKKCTFTIIGGESAVSKKMADAVGKYGNVTRLAGANRFETSVLVAKKYFNDPIDVVLAYAWDFPDGLCGGGLAYAMNAPLILTMTKYESQAARFTETMGNAHGTILGGTGLISNQSVVTIFKKSTYQFWDYQNDTYVESRTCTYQYVTGEACVMSAWDWNFLSGDYEDTVSGYDKAYGVFCYECSSYQMKEYEDYLVDGGFELIGSKTYANGTSYYYYDDSTGFYLDMFVTSDENYLIIEPFLGTTPNL